MPVPKCSFNGSDLWRHLKVHVKKGDIEEGSIEALLTIVRAGHKQRGKIQKRKGKAPLKGKLKKWCPIPGCNSMSLILVDISLTPHFTTSRRGRENIRDMSAWQDSNKEDSNKEDSEEDLIQKKRITGEDPEEENNSEEDPEEENNSEEDPEEENYSEEDPEDEDYASKSKPSRDEFFTAAKPTNNRHRWLVKFFEFLTRPTVGDKKKTIRLQHANQMRTLLEAVDPEGDDIMCLLDNERDAVWKLWVKPHFEAKTKKPRTIIPYLTSFQKFLEFVTRDCFNKTAPKDIKCWRSTVDSQSYDVKNNQMVQESKGLLTLEELAQIKSSKAYSKAERLLIQAGQGREVTLKEFLHMRDFLLTRFSLDTTTHPGPLNNATVQEYKKGNVQDQCKVMLVAKHKRVKDGPATYPMLPDL